MLQLHPNTIRSDFSLHNHSNWSDGSDTLEAMCRAAKAAGLRVFGMSDHWVVPPKPGMNSEEWSMRLDRLPDYVETLKRIRDDLQDDSFQLLIGVEADFFAENHAEVFDNLHNAGLDYIIGSVHYADIFPIDHCADDWKPLSQNQIDDIWSLYWEDLTAAAKLGDFDLIGHIDLPKKFGYMPTFDYTPMALALLDAAQHTHKGIELNTAGWEKTCKEQYPSAKLLAEAKKRQIPILISADAHAVTQVTRHFQEAEALLRTI